MASMISVASGPVRLVYNKDIGGVTKKSKISESNDGKVEDQLRPYPIYSIL